MPEFARYQVWLCDWAGDRILSVFPGREMVSLAWQHTINDVGSYRLQLVAETDLYRAFAPHYGLLIERDYGDGWYEEFYGFHLDSEEWIETSEQGEDAHYWLSMGGSPEWLLTLPLLQPVARKETEWVVDWESLSPQCREMIRRDPTTGRYVIPQGCIKAFNRALHLETHTFYDNWWYYGPADDAIKQMVRESILDDTGLFRFYAYVAVEGNRSEGREITAEGAWVKLLDAIIDAIGQDGSRGNCDFRMTHEQGGFVFRTYSPIYGVDRRLGRSERPTVFSIEDGNLLNPRRRINRTQAASKIYAGWQGGGSEQELFLYVNADELQISPFSVGEVYVDVRDATSPDSVSSRCQLLAGEYSTRREIEFDVVETPSCRYGRDWGIGDLVTLKLWGEEYDMRIIEVTGSLTGEEEEKISGKASLWLRG